VVAAALGRYVARHGARARRPARGEI
jgi:hypothetical protein